MSDRLDKRVRRVDLWPDEFLAAVSGDLLPDELGAYWMICLLIYSRGSAIPEDYKMLANRLGACNPRSVRTIVERLVAKGKIDLNDGRISVERCLNELRKAGERISNARSNGANGGRKSAEARSKTKENNDIHEAPASNPLKQEAKLISTSNLQHTTYSTRDHAALNWDDVISEACRLAGLPPGREAREQGTQRTWIVERLDPELDIYPAIRAGMARKPGGVQGLAYFTNAAKELRDARLAGPTPGRSAPPAAVAAQTPAWPPYGTEGYWRLYVAQWDAAGRRVWGEAKHGPPPISPHSGELDPACQVPRSVLVEFGIIKANGHPPPDLYTTREP